MNTKCRIALIAALTLTACETPNDQQPADNGEAQTNNAQADNNENNDNTPPPKNPDLDEFPKLAQIELPEGFQIRMYAPDVPNARSLELSPNGTLFVGNRSGDKVYAVIDKDNDYRADEVKVIAEGMRSPNGVALHEGDLYVAEISKVWRFKDIEQNLDDPPEPELVSDAFPTDGSHGWKFIKFGPDGKLYVPVGAPCNICKPDYSKYANIQRMDPDGSNLELVAKGVRNTVGFDWHPQTNDLWFTDNGRDMMGDNRPPDELNHVTEKGQHFGYPFCHGGDIPDPEYGDEASCDEFVAPAQKLGPHVAALGMRFYTGDMFPAEYKNQIFIAEHGSWNRSSKIGYRVMMVRLDDEGNATSYEPFATGWLQGESSWGRPVDVELMDDGSMLVSDDASGTVYRIVYVGT
ncbi:sorbosone dehydrogenase family protein [Persicimonas caeni]|uniref:Sorbosone dehydrogenase family protein n=1 Tax=Persicimonas caeni TaxID=2292766 RepID=A0A4Y6PTC1_PERCE|nr:sorbosone dehydrogenase family protein [Persicimonas caeni]QDG51572.1 sorbosone dehydrogenase family protein [Persicimonas caeni]QED32793.1 sorbosone dehydrogenase family protein [Persicimonas caeni]